MATGLVLAAMLVLGVQAGAPASASDGCSDHAFHTAVGEADHLAALMPTITVHGTAGHAKPDKRNCCCQACSQAAIIGISDDIAYRPLIRATARTETAADPDQFSNLGLRRPPRSLPVV